MENRLLFRIGDILKWLYLFISYSNLTFVTIYLHDRIGRFNVAFCYNRLNTIISSGRKFETVLWINFIYELDFYFCNISA